MKHKKEVGFPKEAQCIVNIPSISTTDKVSFVSLQTPQRNFFDLCDITKAEEPTSMNNNNERDYMRMRVRDIAWDQHRKAELDFGLDERDGPRSYKELIEWIKKDKYELDEKRTKYIDAALDGGDDIDYFEFNCFDGIKWTAIKKDYEGCRKAKDEISAAKQRALDIIETQNAEAGLEAMQTFEAFEYKKNKKN